LKIDTVPPVAFQPTPDPAGWSNDQTPQVSFSTTDALSGMDRYEVCVGGGNLTTQASPYILPAQPDGVHDVLVRAFDLAGNHVDGNTTVKVDTGPPVNVSLTINDGEPTTLDRSVWLSLHAEDALSGLDAMAFSDDGAQYTDWESYAEDRDWLLPPSAGQTTIYLKVRDKAGNVAEASNNITLVVHNNTPPRITSDPNVTVEVETLYTYKVIAVDDDGDDLYYSLGLRPDGMLIDVATGVVVWSPTRAQMGVHQVVINVTDGGHYVLQPFKLEVTRANNVPVITSKPQGTRFTEGTTFVYDVEAQDTDPDDSIGFHLEGTPSNMSIDPVTGRIEWTPAKGETGTFHIIVHVEDRFGGRVSQEFDLIVEPRPGPVHTTIEDDLSFLLLILLLIIIVSVIVALSILKERRATGKGG
jgi:hypothetical protein